MRNQLCSRIAPNSVLNARLKAKLKTEYEAGHIKVVFDIGAHKGSWAIEIQSIMPTVRLILFEANPMHAGDLEKSGFEHFVEALSKPGIDECEFYSPESYSGSTGGSYYKEVTPEFNVVDGVKLKTTTLGNIVSSATLPQPDLIKIDTQGSEIDIIEGGAQVFQNAKWVLMELPTVEYNFGAPDIGAYLSRMKELGFLPIELCEVHWSGPVMIQLDFLFVNRAILDRNTLTNLRL